MAKKRKYLVYKSPDYEVYKITQDEPETGSEADIGEDIIGIGLSGLYKFSEMLKEPMGFWQEARKRVGYMIDATEEKVIQIKR